ncbi:hypothetical protein [Pedobacter nutrimenti]|uniref:Lipocalin-like protein n=1 Tax=Pedobacter nutrimenti TaxID=1241337 RepID=A0A318UBB5_9SPHI|nr:hypothetical protein [Pedobacter nutrimenti]PYF69446.1 hypothetical protein B0O44_11086 [Pedobacter nutrimenti]
MNKLTFLALAFCALCSCKKDKTGNDLEPPIICPPMLVSATYSGQLVISPITPTGLAYTPAAVTNTELNFNANNYVSTKGSGTFEWNGVKEMKFTDTNTWQAGFDHNTILNGKYTMESRGDSLFLTKIFEQQISPPPAVDVIYFSYQYRLKRIK